MRHGKKIAKLGRVASHRKAMLANMVTSLFENEVITTTDVRAKELRRAAEHLISFARKNDLHARRQALRVVANKKVVAKLFNELGPRYRGRQGGFTRVVKVGPRRGDGAMMSIVELVDRQGSGADASATRAESAPRERESAESAGGEE